MGQIQLPRQRNFGLVLVHHAFPSRDYPHHGAYELVHGYRSECA